MIENNVVYQQLKYIETLAYNVNLEKIKKDAEERMNTYIVKGIGSVNIEEIVYNGLIAEMGYPSFNLEAYKAQAVAIRTFIKSNKKHKGEGYDLCGTTCCFVYADDKKKQGFKPEQLERFRKAVEETKGELIYYDNKVITTPVFFAYGHNMTNTPNDIWGSDNNRYPYLKSVNTLEKKEPQEIEYTQEEFCKRLGIDNIEHFKIVSKNFNGYNEMISLQQRPCYDFYIYNGNQLRSKLGLKSGIFDVYLLDNGNVKIVCYGYGHGVGMSQFGANELANQGYNYEDILKHYYTGVEIKK